MRLTLTARSSRRMQRAPSLHHSPPTARCSTIIRELMRATNIGFHVFALSGIWAGAMEPLSPVSSHPYPEDDSSSFIPRPGFPQRTSAHCRPGGEK